MLPHWWAGVRLWREVVHVCVLKCCMSTSLTCGDLSSTSNSNTRHLWKHFVFKRKAQDAGTAAKYLILWTKNCKWRQILCYSIISNMGPSLECTVKNTQIFHLIWYKKVLKTNNPLLKLLLASCRPNDIDTAAGCIMRRTQSGWCGWADSITTEHSLGSFLNN